MKAKHWAVLMLMVIGGLYVMHVLTSHGGITGLKQGLGLGSFGK